MARPFSLSIPPFPKKLLIVPAAFVLFSSIHLFHVNHSFEAFTDTLFQEALCSDTVSLHYTLKDPAALGISEYPVTFGSLDPKELSASSESLEKDLKTFQSFSYQSLTGDNQLTYQILETALQNQLALSKYPLYEEPLGPSLGIQAQLPILLAEYAFSSKSDVSCYLELLSKMDTYYASILEYEKAKSAAGLFLSDKTLDAILNQCRSFLENPSENILLTTFSSRISQVPGLSEKEIQSFLAQNETVVKAHVFPAYTLLMDGLEALRGTGTNENGLYYFPEGRKFYACLVRLATGCQVSISSIQTRIQKQIFSDYEKIRGLLTENPGLPEAVRQAMSTASSDPVSILEDLQVKMASDFPKAPAVSCTVKYVDASLENYLSPAFYLTPPVDDLTENVIYINQASGYSSHSLYTTLAHEGYPGHLYQTVYSGTYTTAPIRSILDFSGYTEGWATYVEMMAWDYADLEPELAEVCRLNRSIALGFSSLIDIAVHDHGYTRQQTADYLSSFGYSASSASALFDAVIEAPANYLKYYVGYLGFLDLQNAVKEKEGEQFSLRQFHEQVLQMGPAPFSVLARYIL